MIDDVMVVEVKMKMAVAGLTDERDEMVVYGLQVGVEMSENVNVGHGTDDN